MCSTPYCNGSSAWLDYDEDDMGPALWRSCPCGASEECIPLEWENYDKFLADDYEIGENSDLVNDGCDGCDRTDGGHTQTHFDINGDPDVSICQRCQQEGSLNPNARWEYA